MKKFVSMLLVSAMLLTALTACDNKNDQSGSGDNSSSTTTTDNESSTGESTPDNESSSSDDTIVIPDEPNNPPDETGDDIVIDNSHLEFPDNKAGKLAKAAIATDEWPSMLIEADQERIDAVLFGSGINLDDYDEFCIVLPMMSAQINKVIIVKPKEGSEDNVSTALDAYFEKYEQLSPEVVNYPSMEEVAAGAVKGQTDDGYYYIIVHKNGADVESAMLAAN